MKTTASLAIRLLALALGLAAPLPAIVVATGCGGEAEAHARYHCPMHPTYVSDSPGDCPICGMSLVPIEPAKERQAEAAPASDAGPLHGLAEVTVSEEGVALAGVVTAVAQLAPMTREIRTVGTVVPDETRVRHVHTKISGWVEKLFVGYTGQPVEKGEPILSIFSP
ncbi:MAG: efflux RND transporter periplasmic adaptor subunit, partial [Proteobacteria bacterium]|nr:efflux RND transporter periplasmic adaptor subunit [Pseudomonadota bacterium]